MNALEVREATHRIKFVSGINVRYHQILAFRWGWADRWIRIAMCVTSIAGMWLSVSGESYAGWCSVVGWISLCVAMALNIVPTGEWEKSNAELFRRWSDLYKSAQTIQSRFEMEEKTAASPETRSRIAEAIETEHILHASQPAPCVGLLQKCEDAEYRAVYGDTPRPTSPHQAALSAAVPE